MHVQQHSFGIPINFQNFHSNLDENKSEKED